MKPPKTAFVWLLAVLFAAGCASSRKEPQSLDLENILSAQAEKKAKDEKKQGEEAAPAKGVFETPKQKKTGELAGLIQKSKKDPPELAFLQLPDPFLPVPPRENAGTLKDFFEKKNIKNPVAIWRTKDSAVFIVAEKTKLDPDQISKFTPETFSKELERVGEEYNEFYRNTARARASVKVEKKGSVYVLKVASKYLPEGKDWYSDSRFFYFYSLDYRVSLLISGSEEDLETLRPGLKKAVRKFENRLESYFPAGLSLQKAQNSTKA